MLFTQRSDYGLRAALELAAAWGGPALPAADVARLGDLPEAFARKALGRLAAAGVARARRGRNGGFALSRPPGEIRVAEILEPLQDLAPVRCMSRRSAPPCPVAETDACATRRAWRMIESRIHESLQSMTLADLLAGVRVGEGEASG